MRCEDGRARQGGEQRDAVGQGAPGRGGEDRREQHDALGAAHEAGLALEAEGLGARAGVRDEERGDERDEDRGDGPGVAVAREHEASPRRARRPRRCGRWWSR